MKKNSSAILFFFFFFFFFFIAATKETESTAIITHNHNHHPHHQGHYNHHFNCRRDSISSKSPRWLRNPRPPSPADEIDPRFGVDKRLVPSILYVYSKLRFMGYWLPLCFLQLLLWVGSTWLACNDWIFNGSTPNAVRSVYSAVSCSFEFFEALSSAVSNSHAAVACVIPDGSDQLIDFFAVACVIPDGLDQLIDFFGKSDCTNVISWCKFGAVAPPWDIGCIFTSPLFDVQFKSHLTLLGEPANAVADFVARVGLLGGGFSRPTIFDTVFELCIKDCS
ncbi:hypothetical protein LguiA_028287 [Lonicera macranthoides]